VAKSVLREDMEAHRKECPLEVVQCEYHNVGCEERMMRKRKREHEKEEMEKHLLLTKDMLNTTLKKVDTLMVVLNQTVALQERCRTNSITDTPSILSSAKQSVRLTAMTAAFKLGDQVCPVGVSMTGFSKMKDDDIEWISDSFYSHDKGYKMCLCADPAGDGDNKGTHMSVFLFLMKGPHDDELTWPLRGSFEIMQISDYEHYSATVSFDGDHSGEATGRVITDDDRAEMGWGCPKFISHEELLEVTPTCQYLKDDCVFFQVSKL